MSAPPLRNITATQRTLTSQGVRHIDTLDCGHVVIRSQPFKRRRCYSCLAPCTRCNGTGKIGEKNIDGPIHRGWIHFRCPDCEGDGWMRLEREP